MSLLERGEKGATTEGSTQSTLWRTVGVVLAVCVTSKRLEIRGQGQGPSRNGECHSGGAFSFSKNNGGAKGSAEICTRMWGGEDEGAAVC